MTLQWEYERHQAPSRSPTMQERQREIAIHVRRALQAIEVAVEIATSSTPEGVQLRELAAALDNFATDCERRAQS